MPTTVPINHYTIPITNEMEKCPILLFHANICGQLPALNTLIFSK